MLRYHQHQVDTVNIRSIVNISVSLFPWYCHQIEESKQISLTHTNFKTLNSARGIKNLYILSTDKKLGKPTQAYV